MKKVTAAAGIMMLISSCSHNLDISRELPGTYFMTSQTVEQEGKKMTFNQLKQLKVYTDSQFMYTQLNPADSVSSFGVGSFTVMGDSLVEHAVYSSRGSVVDSQPAAYHLFINMTSDGYDQVIGAIKINGVPSALTESYNRSPKTITSPLDGIWKEVKGYGVSAKNDTSVYKRIQYKAFWNGYFMFGHTVQGDSGKVSTGMGFGNFEMVSNKQFRETDLNSSYPIIAGNTFTIELDMPDKDHFSQTIRNNDGSYSVEFYEKLK